MNNCDNATCKRNRGGTLLSLHLATEPSLCSTRHQHPHGNDESDTLFISPKLVTEFGHATENQK